MNIFNVSIILKHNTNWLKHNIIKTKKGMTKCAGININNHLSLKHNVHYQEKGIIITLST